MAHVDAHDEDWEKDAPILSTLKGKQPFEAPEGYFDTLPGSLMSQIRDLDSPSDGGELVSDSEPSPPRRSWRVGPRTYGVAASIAILAAFGIYLLVRSVDVPINTIPEAVAEQEIHLTDIFDEDEIISNIDFSLVSDEEIANMMGDEALSAWEIDQLGNDLDLELDPVDVQLDDLESLDGLDLEGIEDLF